MYVAKCLCGPRRTSLRFIAKDARKALNNDPTGTRALQRRWSTALDQRWRSIDKMLPQAVARYLDPVDMLSHAASFGSNPVQAFQGWLDEAMRQVIVGTNGAWLLPYVRSATDAGFVHAKRTEPKPVADAFSPDQPRDPHGMWTNSGDSTAKWNSGTASTAKSMPPHVLNGVAFTSYHHEGDWANVKGQANIQEPPLPALRPAQEYTSKDGTSYTVPGDRLSSGVIMHEPDGRVWLTKPTNGFGGYKHSWPKGGVEDGLHPQANAIKEAYEETGLKARITGFAGDFKGDTGVTRMYHAVRVGGHPADKGWESEAVVLARKEDLGKLLNRSRDQKIANTIHGVNIQPKTYKKDAAPPADRTNLLQTFAITELQGIVEAVSQQLVRAFAAGLLAKQSAQQITRAARQVISTVGIKRGRMLASFMCVRAFNAAALDGYRAQGLTHVGIDPERAPAKIVGDAKGSGKGGRTKKAEKKLQQALGEGDVDVLTAEDNDVCDECQGIAENGPYSLDEAEDLIPAHPNCRCAFIPADESVHEGDYLEADDAYNPEFVEELLDADKQPPEHTFVNAGELFAHLTSRYGIRSAFDEQSWNEQDHPRDDHGMFTFAGSGLDKMGTDIGHVASMYNPGTHGHPELMTHYGIEVGAGKDQLAVLASAATHNVDLKELDSGMGRGGVKLYKVTNANGSPVTAPTAPAPTPAPAPTAAHPAEQYKNQVKGTAPERVAMRKQLKGELNPEVSKQLKGKIIASFWKQHDKLPQGEKKQEIADKLAKFTKEYKMPNPLTTAAPAPKAAAPAINPGIDNITSSAEGKTLAKVIAKVAPSVEHFPPEGKSQGNQDTHSYAVTNPKEYQAMKDVLDKGGYKYGEYNSTTSGNKYLGVTIAADHPLPTPAPKSAVTTAATSGNSAALKMSDLTKVGEKMGSNKGGTYQDTLGQKYYVKEPKTEDHVKNELLAAKLYELAGAKTLHYVPIEGGGHVATKLEALDKKNVADLSPAERTQAQKDFGVHAWTGNWDAAGTGGDNQGTLHGNTVTLDVGGSLKYRAQGEPKAFGDKVTETSTLRDPAMNHDANKLYGDMSKEQLHEAYGKVTSLKNSDIVATVQSVYGPGGHANDMAHTLINRKDDLAKQAEALGVKPPPIAITATPAELEKAKKNLPLQMQYVPGASALSGHPEAEKLLKAFNAKYEGKTLTTPEELQKKVNDFNQLKADMVQHMNAHQQAQAVQAVKVQEAKKLAEANSIKAQVKASIAAKAAAPVDFETEALKGVGVSPNGGKYYDSELKSLGITMSGPQKAAISAYVGSSYAHLNNVLRTGKNMNVDQIKFAKVLDTALAKMPVHVGYAQRGIKHDPGFKIFQSYADNVGHVVTENAFSSAGVSHKLWGETTLHIESKTAADISKLNSEGGGEVIFRPGTYLHIKKVNAKTHEVWAEEI